MERTLLRSLKAGCDRFGDLFRRTLADEAGYGFADAQVWAALRHLAASDDHPVAIFGVAIDSALAEGQLRRARVELTDAGRCALRGENPERCTQRWLGGVDLRAADWRWHPEQTDLLRS